MEYYTDEKKGAPMKQDTRQRKKALAGGKAISGQDVGDHGTRDRSGKQALHSVLLEMAPGGRERHIDRERRAIPNPQKEPTSGLGLHRRSEGQGDAPPP
jgi:hypothetical protein